MFKFLCLIALASGIRAEYLYGDLNQLGYGGYGEYASAYDNYKPHDYKFEYGVSDPHTGDHKSQWEVKENGVVRGAYSLLEPDGTTRVVEYYADDTGFHADVKKIGASVHPETVNPEPLPVVYKNLIADNIVYNGYGHGGLVHGYGSPIAAVPHPVVKEVEAPVAHVEAIAPVQQVIVPDAHTYDTPTLVKYATPYITGKQQHSEDVFGTYFNPLMARIIKAISSAFNIPILSQEHTKVVAPVAKVAVADYETEKVLTGYGGEDLYPKVNYAPVSYAPAPVKALYSEPSVYAAPVAKAVYSAPAPVAYSGPAHVAYSAPAQVAYSAPAQVAYSAPAPVAYSAPAKAVYSEYSAPVTKTVYSEAPVYSAKAVYSEPSYSAPANEYLPSAPAKIYQQNPIDYANLAYKTYSNVAPVDVKVATYSSAPQKVYVEQQPHDAYQNYYPQEKTAVYHQEPSSAGYSYASINQEHSQPIPYVVGKKYYH